MAGELNDLRRSLKSTVRGYYTGEEASEFIDQIESAVPGDVSDAFTECTTQGSQSLQDCLADKAEEENLDGSFEDVWDSAPTELLTSLRSLRNQFSEDQRDMIRQVALDADLDDLNRMCAKGDYSEVASEIGMDGQPSNYQECVTATSEAGDVRDTLKEMWGTAS